MPARDGRTFERRNPLDGSVATRAPAAGRPMRSQRSKPLPGFHGVVGDRPARRRELLLKAAHALEAKAPAFAAAMAAETGGSGIWAGFNVHLAAGCSSRPPRMTTQISGEMIPSDVPGCWRWPCGSLRASCSASRRGMRRSFWRARDRDAARLRQHGRAKGSELCPATHGLIVEALQEAGFPPGVVNFVTNAPSDAAAVVEAMIAHPAVRRVNFTGSTRVGRIIAECLRQVPQAGRARTWRQGAAASSSTTPISMPR